MPIDLVNGKWYLTYGTAVRAQQLADELGCTYDEALTAIVIAEKMASTPPRALELHVSDHPNYNFGFAGFKV